MIMSSRSFVLDETVTVEIDLAAKSISTVTVSSSTNDLLDIIMVKA